MINALLVHHAGYDHLRVNRNATKGFRLHRGGGGVLHALDPTWRGRYLAEAGYIRLSNASISAAWSDAATPRHLSQ